MSFPQDINLTLTTLSRSVRRPSPLPFTDYFISLFLRCARSTATLSLWQHTVTAPGRNFTSLLIQTVGTLLLVVYLALDLLCQLITLIHSGSKPKFLTNKSPCNTSAHFSNKDRQCYDHTMHQFDSHEKYKIG